MLPEKVAIPRTTRWKGFAWLVGLVLAFFGVGALSGLVVTWLHLPAIPAVFVGQLGIMLIAVLFPLLDGGGFHPLGLTGSWKGYDPAVIFGILVFHVVGSTITALLMGSAATGEMEGQAVMKLFNQFNQYSPGTFILLAFGMALSAGVGEELLFRGYLISRLERLGVGAFGAILISALSFGMAHWSGYGLLPSVSKAITFGVPTGLFFWYRRSLGPMIVTHFLLDFLSFLLVFVAMQFVPLLPQ